MPFGLTFQTPWILLLLLALPLLPRGRVWWLRALAVALFVVALAQPTLGRPSRAVALLIDTSDSLGTSALAGC